MTTKIRHYESSMSLADLQTTCNTDELDLDGQLQSLDAVQNNEGENVTEAVYDKSKKNNLGNLTIVKTSAISGLQAFNGTAFIEDEVEDVSVFR